MTSIPKTARAIADLADDVDEYAAYIRQVTGDGEAIVDCLIRIMEDDSVGAKPYERLDAQLLLDSIAFGRLALDQESITPPAVTAAPDPPRPANPRRPRRPVLLLSEETLFRLPPLVRRKTDGGQEDGRLPHRRRQGRAPATSGRTTGSGPQSTSPREPTPGRSTPTPSSPDSPSRTP